jgi:hypothetical protein
MFLIDVSPSMGKLLTIELPPGSNGEERSRNVTRLDWVLEFVMLKVQEMVGKKFETPVLNSTHEFARYLAGGRQINVALSCLVLKVRTLRLRALVSTTLKKPSLSRYQKCREHGQWWLRARHRVYTRWAA